MLLDPVTGCPPRAPTRCSTALDHEVAGHTAAETHGSAVELATDPHETVAGAVAQLGELRDALDARAGRAGPRRAPSRARIRWRAGRTPRSPPAPATSSSTPRCASWRGASRRSPCTCTSPCPTPDARDPRAQRRARAPAGAARAVGQLAVLAGPRQRARLGAHADLPGVPAHRPAAPLRELRGVRRGRRRAAALRRVPRADVPVVGRAPAAASSARSRCGSWTPRRGWRTPRALAALVQCLVRREALEGDERRADAAPRCSRRTASWPRATAWRRARRPRARPLRARSPTCSTSSSRACAPHARAASAARASWRPSPSSPRRRARPASASSAAGPAGLAGVLRALDREFPRPARAGRPLRA